MRDVTVESPSYCSKLINSIAMLRRSNGDLFLYSIRRDLNSHADLVSFINDIYSEFNSEGGYDWINFSCLESTSSKKKVIDSINNILLKLINSSDLHEFIMVLVNSLNLLLR
jgi:hypothetical protein